MIYLHEHFHLSFHRLREFNSIWIVIGWSDVVWTEKRRRIEMIGIFCVLYNFQEKIEIMIETYLTRICPIPTGFSVWYAIIEAILPSSKWFTLNSRGTFVLAISVIRFLNLLIKNEFWINKRIFRCVTILLSVTPFVCWETLEVLYKYLLL